MEDEVKITPKMTLTARVFRAHPKPEDMTDEDYASKIVIQDTSVGHWDDLGEIARNEDGTLHLKSRTLE